MERRCSVLNKFGFARQNLHNKRAESGSRGGLFGTSAPTASTAAPSFVGSFDFDFDFEEDDNGAEDAPREVAAAQKLLSGGSAGAAAAVVTMVIVALVAGVLP